MHYSAFSVLRPFYTLLKQLEKGENDGLVSVDSSKWGTFLGTIEANHLEQINWNYLGDNKNIYRSIAVFLADLERTYLPELQHARADKVEQQEASMQGK